MQIENFFTAGEAFMIKVLSWEIHHMIVPKIIFEENFLFARFLSSKTSEAYMVGFTVFDFTKLNRASRLFALMSIW